MYTQAVGQKAITVGKPFIIPWGVIVFRGFVAPRNNKWLPYNGWSPGLLSRYPHQFLNCIIEPVLHQIS